MTPEKASIVLEFLQPHIVYESNLTRKVLAAVPAGKCDYQPDPVSMTAIKLSAHIATVDKMFLTSVLQGVFVPPDPASQPALDSPEQVLAFYDGEVTPLIGKLADMPGEHLARKISALGGELPTIELLDIYLRHCIHHRGQLSAYLRSMGAKVPAIYGGSADEPITAKTAKPPK